MKLFTFRFGITEGIALTKDEKLGQIVFLGELGRGRRYEKVGLSRRNPPQIVDGKVFEAEPQKITLPKNGNLPEKSFWVLKTPEKKTSVVLVRINCEGTYTKNSVGRWETIEGSPETIIEGYGAYGLAGRIGSWHDGLVQMKPGDVLKIKHSGGYKNRPYALFFNTEGKLSSMDF